MKRKRKFASADHARQARELEASWQAILKKHAPKPVKQPQKNEVAISPRSAVIRDTPTHGTSLHSGVDPKPVAKRVTQYEGEMLERDIKAKERYEQLKKQVAPICNKGGYQLITNQDDFKTMGRKV